SLAFLFALFASFELFSLSLHDALPIWKWVVVNRLDDDSARLLSRMVNRIALGMMASGMFVGSSLLLSFGGEQALSIPAIRWLATGMLWGSAIIALYVVWRVIRSKRA